MKHFNSRVIILLKRITSGVMRRRGMGGGGSPFPALNLKPGKEGSDPLICRSRGGLLTTRPQRRMDEAIALAHTLRPTSLLAHSGGSDCVPMARSTSLPSLYLSVIPKIPTAPLDRSTPDCRPFSNTYRPIRPEHSGL